MTLDSSLPCHHPPATQTPRVERPTTPWGQRLNDSNLVCYNTVVMTGLFGYVLPDVEVALSHGPATPWRLPPRICSAHCCWPVPIAPHNDSPPPPTHTHPTLQTAFDFRKAAYGMMGATLPTRPVQRVLVLLRGDPPARRAIVNVKAMLAVMDHYKIPYT